MRALLCCLALTLTVSASATPLTLSHSGRLLDAQGAPLNGTQTLTFALYNSDRSSDPLWEESQSVVLHDGVFSVSLGTQTPLSDGLFAQQGRFIEVSHGAVAIGARQPIATVPYAITAHSVAGGVVDASELRINNVVVIGSDGQLTEPTYSDEQAVAAHKAALHTAVGSGRYIKLYGYEITGDANNTGATHPQLNITATHSNHIGSARFEAIGSPYNGWAYSGGPKATWWTTGNLSWTFYAAGGEVYVDLGSVNGVYIRSTAPIAPAVVSSIPSGAQAFARLP